MDSPIHRNTIDETVRRRRSEGLTPNRLIAEKSPYLLQHAFNPVDWHPWGEEAFEKARTEDKPIFLSIGYSTCYWCHVMEREVFEDPEIAALMNRTVVNIKVDREERPDVDRVYMTALMGMTGSGGWPMSMFLTPDLKPFFGATYIPPTARYGREGFPDLLQRIHELWTRERSTIVDAGRRLAEFLQQTSNATPAASIPDRASIGRGVEVIARTFDRQHGGFGGAPKFPTPVVIDLLLRYHRVTGSEEARSMAVRTLDGMLDGGIADHLGGGFHRYATDAAWHVPHFEKMLYDQALLACVYLEAYQTTGFQRYRASVQETLGYVLRDLMDPDGGFWSAEDAESVRAADRPDDKEEGAFYVWTEEEIAAALDPIDARLVEYVFDVRSDGNVAADPHGVFSRKNILHRVHTTVEAADHVGISEAEVEIRLASVRRRLWQVRQDRPRPGLDDKILTGWNGLMISACARAYQVLRLPEYRSAGERAADRILDSMVDRETRTLFRRLRDGEARHAAVLEDYAYLVQGLLDLYEASFDIRWLRAALEWMDRQLGLFWDEAEGGCYDDAKGPLASLVRTKEWHDGATPSANGVTALNLLRLAAMLKIDRYADMADRLLRLFGAWIERSPQGAAHWLAVLQSRYARTSQVIIAGAIEDPRTLRLVERVQARFDPHRVMLLADGVDGQSFLTSRMPFFEAYRPIDGSPAAYVCRDFSCRQPTCDPDELEHLIASETQ